jgi:hypothetical protein
LTLTSFICQPKLLQLPEARDRFLRGEKLFIVGRLYALGWSQVAKQKIVAKRRDVAALYANREVAWLGRAIIVDRRRATDGLPTSRAPVFFAAVAFAKFHCSSPHASNPSIISRSSRAANFTSLILIDAFFLRR